MCFAARVFGAIACGALSLLSISCTAASTSLAGPSAAAKCQVSVAGGPASFSAGGGAGTVNVQAGRECTWNAAAGASWVRITSPTTGQGEAALAFSVSSNPVPTPRSSSIAVEGATLQIDQAAAPCVFTLSQTHKSVSHAGETVRVDVTTLSGCAWTTTSDASWITVTAGQSGNASGTVVFSVSRNTGAARTGQAHIANQIFTFAQEAVPSAPPPAPPSPSPPPSPVPTPPEANQEVELEGRISGLSGQCPNVSFSLAGRTVGADGNTDYKEGRCRDLSNGVRVEVRGTLHVNGGVYAKRIKFD
jgi:hypothetical protein